MPAIPVHARIEAHLTDQELGALREFLYHAITLHQAGVDPSPLVRAAGGNQMGASVMLSACREVYQAISRAQDERAA